MRTRAAILREVGQPLEVVELELASPRQGEILIRVAACGVCHSDWHLCSGDTQHPLPVALGHEGAGVVEAVGAGVDLVAEGDHVALNWAPFCGRCFYCEADRPGLCSTYVEPLWAGTLMDGTTRLTDPQSDTAVYQYTGLGCLAERVVVPASCCVPMSTDLPLEIVALIGCAVTTGVGAVLNTAEVTPGSSVAVFGCGGVGLSAIQGARYAQAETIIAVDSLPAKAAAAQEHGAHHHLAADEHTAERIRELTSGRGADFVIEAVGHPQVQQAAFAAARPGGTVVLAGLAPMGSETNLPGALITRQEKTIKGSYYGTANIPRDFPRYAELYQHGQLELDRLITRRYSLDEINEAFSAMLSGSVARGVVVFS